MVQWSYVSEIFNENTTAARTGGQCAKVKLLETAAALKWSAEQVATVAKSLGLK